MMKKTLVAVLFMVAALASCGVLPPGEDDSAGTDPVGVSADDEDYDFSVFFGHSEDPIAAARIVSRYKDETGVSVRPIMADEDAADDHLLKRYLNSADPPAAFALPEGAEALVSASGIGWRFHGRGLAADRRVLADLIGAPDAADPAVDAFVEDIRLAGYGEWSMFIGGLDSYIDGTTYAAITLNGKPYSFAEAKGSRSSRLNGVFAVGGADPAFAGTMLMDMASATAGYEFLDDARLLPTPQAFSIADPVFGAYIEALDSYTSRVGGLYASGIRGDDFINAKIYSPEYTDSVFVGNRAVFTPFDSGDYGDADASQREYIVLLPIKMPYDEHRLGAYLGAAAANASLQMRTEYSLCVNDQVSPDKEEKAQAFVEWLLADAESSNAVQLCLAAYHAGGARLPLLTDVEREDMGDAAALGEKAFASVLKPMLSDPDWQEDEIMEFRDALRAAWHGEPGGAS